MIYEYAIDPEVILKWAGNTRDYSEGIREYGLGTPRILSSFPRQKARKLRSFLLQAAPLDDQSLHSRRYVELVNALTETSVNRPVLNTGSSDWITNLLLMREAGPAFDLVITEYNERIPGALKPSGLYSNDSFWNHPKQECMERTIEDLNRVIGNFLKYSSDQVFVVDPYAWNDRSILVIQNIIEKLQHRINSQDPMTVSIFYKQKHKKDNPNSKAVLEKILRDIPNLSCSLTVCVKELDTSENLDIFHNRYLLTPLGGVILGSGVDVSEDPNHTDDAILMDKFLYARRWNQYVTDLQLVVISSKSNRDD